eukprot:CAMPEP_0201121830 /NCGR_PEP_ID=MMETSP0850-20130426/5620_1 /ASSEMBLY_ACC=CAM_ASM_000622 /TAXON_ID=183588 /ORGANISM="Pseudo-nitzschia fraudulenta, Strain WWA7" /LENGTH=457 /DNA_ID=CAMNT_0047388385 /DNA_START=256 /DNA_END=1629 /DNA_ORIENTATION=+
MSGEYGSYIDVDERAPRNIEPFDEWTTTCGVQRADGVRLSYTNPEDQYNQDDISAVTDVDIPAGQPVLGIPANMILSSSSSKEELEAMSDSLDEEIYNSDAGGIRKAVDLLSRLGAGDTVPKFYLFLKVLLEYTRGTESPYYPWLDSLPRLYYNSVSMTDFCYECLPPLVFSLSRRERVKFDNFHDALKKIDSRIFPEDLKSDKDGVLKWAFNVVHTRCFSGNQNGNSGDGNGIGESVAPGEEQRIVPMADMLNHGTETDVEISYDEEGNCNVYSVRDIPAGSPLQISYGCPTNPSEFFATYGFLDETSPATFCKIMNIQPTPELKTIGLDFSRMLFFKDTGDISAEVWDVLLYSKVLSNDIETKNAFYEAHVNGDEDTKNAIHQQYMDRTSKELKSHVDTFLEQLDGLQAKADDKDWNEHPRLPLILRHNEFVRSTFENVKLRLDPMVEEYMYQEA